MSECTSSPGDQGMSEFTDLPYLLSEHLIRGSAQASVCFYLCGIQEQARHYGIANQNSGNTD